MFGVIGGRELECLGGGGGDWGELECLGGGGGLGSSPPPPPPVSPYR